MQGKYYIMAPLGGAVPQPPARDVTPLDPLFAFAFPQCGKANADVGSKRTIVQEAQLGTVRRAGTEGRGPGRAESTLRSCPASKKAKKHRQTE